MNQPRALHPYRAGQRTAAVLFAALGMATAASACRDLVAGDAVDVATVLCDTFSACGVAAGCARVDDYFGSADDAARDQYLATFGELGCAEGCGAATGCLDFRGICDPPGTDASCESGVLCCGGSSGEAHCEAGKCCLDLAVPCETDPECCPIDGKTIRCVDPGSGAVDEETGGFVKTCGGLPACGVFGTECGGDTACCSGTCVDGFCDRLTCVASGDKCLAGDTCCESPKESCSARGVCEAPNPCADPASNPAQCCADDGGGCSPRDGAPGLPCCGSEAAVCFEQLDGSGVCSLLGCAPGGSRCGSDADCCQPETGSGNVACLTVAGGDGVRVCQALSCEPDVGEECGDGCCAGLECLPDEKGDLKCREACGIDGECHDPTQIGANIIPSACDQTDEEQAYAACARDICISDPFCCCHSWDSICVGLALQTCAFDP